MIRTQPQQNPSPLLRRSDATQTHRAATLFITIYSVCMMLIGVLGGWQLYTWARTRIIAVSSGEVSPTLLQAIGATQPATANSAAVSNNNPAATNPTAAVDLPAINILLLGTDERPRDNDTANTDTLILLTLNPQTKRAGMLSFSRDLWVPVPGLEYNTKLNTVYGIGEQREKGSGELLTMQTVSRLVGQPIQYYVRLNFNGFVQLVDSINGIDIMVPKTIHDEEYPTANFGVETFHLNAGPQHLDGETALKYARTRHVDDDYGRQRRQQDVIRAVFDKVRSADMIPSLLANLPKLLNSIESNLFTDLPWLTQIAYTEYLRQTGLQGIEREQIDGRLGEASFNDLGQWVLIPNRDAVRQTIDSYWGKLTAPQSQQNAASGNAGVVDTSWVRIEVLNGSGVPKIAAHTTELLRAKGWNVVYYGDADRASYEQTLVVSHGNIPADILARVNADLPISLAHGPLAGLKPTTTVDITIVVGKDLAPRIGN